MTGRIDLLDNTKFVMIGLVVFGHIIEPLIDRHALLKTIYLSVYSFHMPVFVMIAGMLAKARIGGKDVAAAAGTILVPLLIFTALYEGFDLFTRGAFSSSTRNFEPYWILWFLLSLFFWRLLLPVVLACRVPLFLTISIAIAAGACQAIGYGLGLSRTLVFFPFFVLGHLLAPTILSETHKRRIPKLIWLIIPILNIGLFTYLHDMPHQWLYGSYAYASLHVDIVSGAAVRLLLYGVSFGTAVAVLFLMPAKSTIISAAGANSLYAYLWHGFLIKLLIGNGIIGLIGQWSPMPTLAAAAILAVALTWVLSFATVARGTQRIFLAPARRLLRLSDPVA